MKIIFLDKSPGLNIPEKRVMMEAVTWVQQKHAVMTRTARTTRGYIAAMPQVAERHGCVDFLARNCA